MSTLILDNDKDTMYKDPLKFIDTLGGKKHIVLYYENPKFGKVIQFKFLMDGLLKGENSIYAMNNEENHTSVEYEMIRLRY